MLSSFYIKHFKKLKLPQLMTAFSNLSKHLCEREETTTQFYCYLSIKLYKKYQFCLILIDTIKHKTKMKDQVTPNIPS